MILNKLYKFDKSFKVEITTRSMELKDRLLTIKEDSMKSYYITHVSGFNIPFLIDKNRLCKSIKDQSIVEVDDEYAFKDFMYSEKRIPINEESLLKSGYYKKAGIYINGINTVYLIKGHTWHLTTHKDKFGKDVKYIDELN